MNTNKLVLKDGFLCIENSTTYGDQPEMLTVWYPVHRCTPGEANFSGYPIGADMVSTGSFTYRTKEYSGPMADGRAFELRDYGATVPIAHERRPVPAPKSTRRLRWCNGQWQKLLKTGWIPA